MNIYTYSIILLYNNIRNIKKVFFHFVLFHLYNSILHKLNLNLKFPNFYYIFAVFWYNFFKQKTVAIVLATKTKNEMNEQLFK